MATDEPGGISYDFRANHVHEAHAPGSFAERRLREIEQWNVQVEARHVEIVQLRRAGATRSRGRRPTSQQLADSVSVMTCRHCGTQIHALPHTRAVPIIRTDFSEESEWRSVVSMALSATPEGFQADAELVDDFAFHDLLLPQLLDRLPENFRHRVLFVVDQTTISRSHQPVLAVDLNDEPGRSFRLVPSMIQAVENNMTLANLDFAAYADAVGADEVFRGF